jgi:hypothetical protein
LLKALVRIERCAAGDGGSVGGHGGSGDRADLAGPQAVVPAGDDDAGHQSLHVPLERPRVGLVEVVEVEHQTPIGRGEEAEVRQMGVAAELDGQVGGGAGRQVGGHHRGRSSQEGERTGPHALVPDGDQLGQTGGVLRPQDTSGVPGSVEWCEVGVGLVGQALASDPAGFGPGRLRCPMGVQAPPG